MQLNPDTIIHDHALDHLVKFIEENPHVGICGPKVLNPDGSLQKPCRRGEPRPWAVISYFTGLAKRFPEKPFFSEYYLGYKDENETHPVAGVAGSCMLIRREVVDQIGYLDEQFFAYQEDADYCFRARQAGWQVYYYPDARIIHYGGKGGSAVEPMRSTIQWHRSYYLYYRKHLARDYFFLFNWLYYTLMLIKLLVAMIKNSFSRKPFGGSRKPG
jgi:GT2 family glycosyltransferase